MLKSKVILKTPRITEKALPPKDGVWGWANKEDFEIDIEKLQCGKEYLNTLIHEMLHCMLPDLSERSITKMADIMAAQIWKRRYRRLSK